MTILMLLAAFALGVVAGVWITWNVMRERQWREEWARAIHPSEEV